MREKLRIGLINQGGHGWIGGEIYIFNIVKALAALPLEERADVHISLLMNSSADALTCLAKCYDFVECVELENELLTRTFTSRLHWKLQKTLAKRADPRFEHLVRQRRLDFVYPYFVPHGLGFAARACAWIPDFQHRYLPHLFTENELRARERRFFETALCSERVVVSSQAVAEDFRKFYPTSHSRTEILHFRTSPSSDWFTQDPDVVRRKYHLPERYFILCGQFWQHKNHMLVLEALSRLRSEGIRPTVVCTGHLYDYRKAEHSDRILQTIHLSGLSDQVRILGLIPRLDQIQLIRDCIGVVQPSLFEGWSTVVEDARCLGRPLILSDLDVHVEQSPPGSIYFDRTSPNDLARHLADWWVNGIRDSSRSLERRARQKNHEEVQAFARRFLEIARQN